MTEPVNDRILQAATGGIVLRPGVAFPDWSVIDSPVAGDTVSAMVDAFGVETRWRGYSGNEDRVHTMLLRRYARQGRAPTPGELVADTGLAAETIKRSLASLADRDMVVLDPSDSSITGAYPLTERDTGHRVTLGDRVLNAMCAIDALGAGAMYGVDSRIHSTCRHCGAAIQITTANRGAVLADVSPPEAVVLAGIDYEGCAANSLCPVIAFFCRDEHLETWQAENRGGEQAYRLSLDEALQVGRAMFVPFLAGAADDQTLAWG